MLSSTSSPSFPGASAACSTVSWHVSSCVSPAGSAARSDVSRCACSGTPKGRASRVSRAVACRRQRCGAPTRGAPCGAHTRAHKRLSPVPPAITATAQLQSTGTPSQVCTTTSRRDRHGQVAPAISLMHAVCERCTAAAVSCLACVCEETVRESVRVPSGVRRRAAIRGGAAGCSGPAGVATPPPVGVSAYSVRDIHRCPRGDTQRDPSPATRARTVAAALLSSRRVGAQRTQCRF